MTTIDVGAAIGSGFGLIRRKPLAVLAWGALMALGIAALVAAYVGFFWNFYVNAAVFQAGGAQPTPAQTYRMVAAMLMGEGLFFMAVFTLQLIYTIVSAAIWRAILHPEKSSWAYLRVGVTEVFVFLVRTAASFVAGAPIFILLPVMFIALGLAVAFQQIVIAVVVYVLGVFAAIGAQLYLWLRFSLIGPMVVDDAKLHFIGAWQLSRGNVLRLFYIGLSLVGIGAIAEAILLAVILLLIFVGFSSSAATMLGAWVAPVAPGTLRPWEMSLSSGVAEPLWIVLAIGGFLAIPVAGCFSAIFTAPWARAYRDLVPRPASPTPDVAPATALG